MTNGRRVRVVVVLATIAILAALGWRRRGDAPDATLDSADFGRTSAPSTSRPEAPIERDAAPASRIVAAKSFSEPAPTDRGAAPRIEFRLVDAAGNPLIGRECALEVSTAERKATTLETTDADGVVGADAPSVDASATLRLSATALERTGTNPRRFVRSVADGDRVDGGTARRTGPGRATVVVGRRYGVVGRIVDEEGRPVDGVPCILQLRETGGAAYAADECASDEDGRFSLCVPEDPHPASASADVAEAFVSATPSESTSATRRNVALDVAGDVDAGDLVVRRPPRALFAVFDEAGAVVREPTLTGADAQGLPEPDRGRGYKVIGPGVVRLSVRAGDTHVFVGALGFVDRLTPIAGAEEAPDHGPVRVVLARAATLVVRFPGEFDRRSIEEAARLFAPEPPVGATEVRRRTPDERAASEGDDGIWTTRWLRASGPNFVREARFVSVRPGIPLSVERRRGAFLVERFAVPPLASGETRVVELQPAPLRRIEATVVDAGGAAKPGVMLRVEAFGTMTRVGVTDLAGRVVFEAPHAAFTLIAGSGVGAETRADVAVGCAEVRVRN